MNPEPSTGTISSHSSAHETYHRPSPSNPETAGYGAVGAADSQAYQFNNLAASLPPTGSGMNSTRREAPSYQHDQHRPRSSMGGGPAPTSYPQDPPYYTTSYSSSSTQPHPPPLQMDPNNRLPPPTEHNAYSNPGPILPTLQPGVRPGPDSSLHERLRPSAAGGGGGGHNAGGAAAASSSSSSASRSGAWHDPQRGEGRGSRRAEEQHRPPPARPRRIWEHD